MNPNIVGSLAWARQLDDMGVEVMIKTDTGYADGDPWLAYPDDKSVWVLRAGVDSLQLGKLLLRLWIDTADFNHWGLHLLLEVGSYLSGRALLPQGDVDWLNRLRKKFDV